MSAHEIPIVLVAIIAVAAVMAILIAGAIDPDGQQRARKEAAKRKAERSAN